MPGLYGASDCMTREVEQWSTEKVEDSFLWRCVDASLGLGRAAIVNLVRSSKCTRGLFATVPLDHKCAQS